MSPERVVSCPTCSADPGRRCVGPGPCPDRIEVASTVLSSMARAVEIELTRPPDLGPEDPRPAVLDTYRRQLDQLAAMHPEETLP